MWIRDNFEVSLTHHFIRDSSLFVNLMLKFYYNSWKYDKTAIRNETSLGSQVFCSVLFRYIDVYPSHTSLVLIIYFYISNLPLSSTLHELSFPQTASQFSSSCREEEEIYRQQNANRSKKVRENLHITWKIKTKKCIKSRLHFMNVW